jgi:hypothetical protein
MAIKLLKIQDTCINNNWQTANNKPYKQVDPLKDKTLQILIKNFQLYRCLNFYRGKTNM